MKEGQWLKIPGRSLSECTIGVIGLGNVGTNTAQRAFGFGCKILGTDVPEVLKSSKCINICEKYSVEQTGIDDLCSRSDFVCVCAQLEHKGDYPTYHLINAKRLAMMKRSAVVVNCARGPIVDEKALVAALTSNPPQIAGAALDVFEDEPLPSNSPLCDMDNVLMAPHNSNSSPTAHEAVHWSTLKNLLRGLGLEFTEQRKILADSQLR